MADKARTITDKELVKLEKKLKKEYKQAQKELTKKWVDYMAIAESKIKDAKKAYLEALKEGSDVALKKAANAYQKELLKYTLNSDKYKAMVEDVTSKLANVNEVALSYVNNTMPKIYATNYNAVAPSVERLGVDFTLYNEHVVRNLVKQGKVELPKKKVDVPKDKRWNTKKLNSAVLQGILQGESMDKIADRILPVVDNNEKAAIRNARTMVTGAENKGRLDSYNRMLQKGVIMAKRWIATADERTRSFHLEMDGQICALDEKFEDGNGNELDYPGDPKAKPETVYNCRCSMGSHIIGFLGKNGLQTVDQDLHEHYGLHEKQIAQEVKRRDDLKAAKAQKPKSGNPKKDGVLLGSGDKDDRFSAERKNKAVWAKTEREYDDIKRAQAGRVWNNATDEEKDAVYAYTRGSEWSNKPLRGYEGYGWANHVGTENIEITRETADRIDAATRYIASSKMEQDTWLQRGVNTGGAASFLGIPEELFDASEEEMANAILGKTVRDDAFCSHGSTKGTGFDGIIFNTYCPKGTQAAYCEPFSYFGSGDERQWDGISKQSTFGDEFETLLQRGTDFRVTKVQKRGDDWFIDVEVTGQNPEPLEKMFKRITEGGW